MDLATHITERLATLRRLISAVVEIVNDEIRIESGIPDVLSVDDAAIFEANAFYWREVERFKHVNGFANGRINWPKKAALSCYSLVVCRPIVICSARNLDHSFMEFALLQVAVEIMKRCLQIGREHLSPEHQRDLLRAMLRVRDCPEGKPRDAAMHFLCVYMDAHWGWIQRWRTAGGSLSTIPGEREGL